MLDELIRHVCDAMTLDVARISLHGDCHPGNILWRDGPCLSTRRLPHRPRHSGSLDDAERGRHEQQIQLDTLLAGYEEFMEFDHAGAGAHRAAAAMRIVHYMAWLAGRWEDPAPRHFPWFNTEHYWRPNRDPAISWRR